LKVYVAGSYTGRHRIAKEAARLEELGFTVLSRWFHDENFVEQAWDKDFSGEVAQTMAEVDMYAVLRADLVIMDSFEPSSTGGRYAELGAAVMRRLLGHPVHVIHIGPPTNIFETLVGERFNSWNEYINKLQSRLQ
jgi:hypothetical protein